MVPGVVAPSASGGPAVSWFERRSCRCKIRPRLASRREARLAACVLVRREGGRLDPYRCRFCGGWHVGHPMARR